MIIRARDFMGSRFFCVNGAKAFCCDYKISWDKLVQEGYDSKEFLELCNYDAQAVHCVEYALKNKNEE